MSCVLFSSNDQATWPKDKNVIRKEYNLFFQIHISEIFMENMGYVNITAGLSDPASLNSPPLGCENAPLVSAHYVSNFLFFVYHMGIYHLDANFFIYM